MKPMGAGVGTMEQDYLKTIWKAQEWSERAITTNELAATLGVAASTVSGNLKKLSRDGLVDHTPYGKIQLSERGMTIALRMVRRHRLIETYLVRQHGYGWDEVHDEAEVLEHAVSDRFLDRIDLELGHPTSDPHGDPIPAADGTVIRPEALPLPLFDDGACGHVARVSDDDPELLKYLSDIGIRPGAHVRVQTNRDYAGSLAISRSSAGDETDAAQLELATSAAQAVWVATGPHAH